MVKDNVFFYGLVFFCLVFGVEDNYILVSYFIVIGILGDWRWGCFWGMRVEVVFGRRFWRRVTL